jgi:hypothetical protein
MMTRRAFAETRFRPPPASGAVDVATGDMHRSPGGRRELASIAEFQLPVLHNACIGGPLVVGHELGTSRKARIGYDPGPSVDCGLRRLRRFSELQQLPKDVTVGDLFNRSAAHQSLNTSKSISIWASLPPMSLTDTIRTPSPRPIVYSQRRKFCDALSASPTARGRSPSDSKSYGVSCG